MDNLGTLMLVTVGCMAVAGLAIWSLFDIVTAWLDRHSDD